MELRLSACRQSFHVEARRSKESFLLGCARKTYFQSVQCFNEASILNRFPSSIFELETLVSSENHSECLFDCLEDNFSSMFQQVDLNNSEVFRCWANIMNFIFKTKTKAQQQFLEKYFKTFAETALSLQEFGGFFAPLMSIDVSKLSEQQCEIILLMIHRDMQSPCGSCKNQNTQHQKDNTPKLFWHPENGSSSSLDFLYRVLSLYNWDCCRASYEMVFRILFCSQTILLIKKLFCEGLHQNSYRYTSLSVMTNLAGTEDLDNQFYEQLLEDSILDRLKQIICKEGTFQETAVAWKLVFNFFCETNYRQVILEDYMGMASDFIIQSKTPPEILRVISSLFIHYFNQIDADELPRFEQIRGFLAITRMLRVYAILEQSDLKILLAAILKFVRFSMETYGEDENPCMAKFRQEGLIKQLVSIRRDGRVELNQLVQEILDIFDELNNL